MAGEYAFVMKDLRKVVPPKREILRGIYLSFFHGAKIGVLGANGAGKSSLLRIMAGVDRDFLGEAVAATLADLREPADVVEVFRRPQFLPGHAAEIVRLPWKPSVVWFQLGIRNDSAAETLARAGIRVVQDRCMMPEHRRLLGAA